MLDKKQLCNQISLLYPDLGQCGVNLHVNWNEEKQAWAVDFEFHGNKIRHYLESVDAIACVIEKQCEGMGIEFG